MYVVHIWWLCTAAEWDKKAYGVHCRPQNDISTHVSNTVAYTILLFGVKSMAQPVVILSYAYKYKLQMQIYS